MIALPTPPRARAEADRRDASPAAVADRLLDRLHAFTTVAYDACDAEDVSRLESAVDQRGAVLVELERVLAALRTPLPGDPVDPSIDLLARRIRAFEVLEAKLVERVRRLRDDVQEAIERAARNRHAVTGYRQAIRPAAASRCVPRSA
jgi:hypothetical protein